MKFDWKQFVISGEEFKLTEQTSLVARPTSGFSVHETITSSIPTVEKPIRKIVVIGDISLRLLINPGTTKGDIALGIEAASKFLLKEERLKRLDISYWRIQDDMGNELLPNIDIEVEIEIEIK